MHFEKTHCTSRLLVADRPQTPGSNGAKTLRSLSRHSRLLCAVGVIELRKRVEDVFKTFSFNYFRIFCEYNCARKCTHNGRRINVHYVV